MKNRTLSLVTLSLCAALAGCRNNNTQVTISDTAPKTPSTAEQPPVVDQNPDLNLGRKQYVLERHAPSMAATVYAQAALQHKTAADFVAASADDFAGGQILPTVYLVGAVHSAAIEKESERPSEEQVGLSDRDFVRHAIGYASLLNRVSADTAARVVYPDYDSRGQQDIATLYNADRNICEAVDPRVTNLDEMYEYCGNPDENSTAVPRLLELRTCALALNAANAEGIAKLAAAIDALPPWNAYSGSAYGDEGIGPDTLALLKTAIATALTETPAKPPAAGSAPLPAWCK